MSENKDFLDEFYKDEDSTGQTGDLASGGASGDMGDDFLFGSSFVERVDADGNTIGGQSSPQLGEQQPIQPDLTSEEKVQHIARTEKTGRTARTAGHKKTARDSKAGNNKSSFAAAFSGLKNKAVGFVNAQAKSMKQKSDERKAARDEESRKEHAAHRIEEAEEQVEKAETGKKRRNDRVIRRRREKSFGCLGGILYFLFIACISVVLGSLGWMYASDMLGMSSDDGTTVQIVVPDDFTIDSVTDTLYDNGVISYKFLFKFYASLSSADEKIEPGTYEINTASDYRAVVNNMRGESGTRATVKVTIPEGYTMKQIFERLAENEVCTEEELWRAATEFDFNYDFLDREDLGNPYRLEGYLFPDTYEFYIGETPENTISKFIDNFAAKWQSEYTARANELGMTMDDILIIASIIEREAGRLDEMGYVSSVIHNRLNAGMTLGMESTLNYIAEMTGEEMSSEVDSPYNTYMYTGLPEGAIANPGLDSIYAALHPESTNYYYFALGADGFTHFFTNYDAFLAFTNSDEYGG